MRAATVENGYDARHQGERERSRGAGRPDPGGLRPRIPLWAVYGLRTPWTVSVRRSSVWVDIDCYCLDRIDAERDGRCTDRGPWPLPTEASPEASRLLLHMPRWTNNHALRVPSCPHRRGDLYGPLDAIGGEWTFVLLVARDGATFEFGLAGESWHLRGLLVNSTRRAYVFGRSVLAYNAGLLSMREHQAWREYQCQRLR